MTSKEIFLVVASDLHQTYTSMQIVGVAMKNTDAQKLYAKALKYYGVTTKHDGTDNNDYCIAVYKAETVAFSENILREGEKLYSSENC